MTAANPAVGAVRAVLFDYGGVLTTPVGASIDAWLATDGLERATFDRAMLAWTGPDSPVNNPVHRMETGRLTPEEFEVLLAAAMCAIDGRISPRGVMGRMFAAMLPDPEMFAHVRELRAAGIRTGLLSNSWASTYPRDLIAEHFEVVVISGEVGLRKPEPAIYQHALELLGLPAGEVAFVDDLATNVAGARGLGLHAVQHADSAGTWAAITALTCIS